MDKTNIRQASTRFVPAPGTVQQVLYDASSAFEMTMHWHQARLQAEILLSHTLGMSRSMLLARLDEPISPGCAVTFGAAVARRVEHEPLAYVLGHCEFYGLDLVVDPRVLIPRHETELVVEIALKHVQRLTAPRVADVGTGSGAIALALARHLPSAQIFATDISPDALAVARLNASRLGLGQIHFLEDDLLTTLERFDLVVANLPYIPAVRYAQLPPEVRDFEPRLALDGGLDGLGILRRLFGQLQSRTHHGSIALLEISEEQGSAATELAHRELPQVSMQLHRDFEGLDRVLELLF